MLPGPGKMGFLMLRRQNKRSLLLFVLASCTWAHAQHEVPNEIFQRTLLIRSGDEQATALKLDQGGRIYLVTTRRLGKHLPPNNAVVQVWHNPTWIDLQTVRTIFPASKDVDLATLETSEQIARPYAVVKGSEVLTSGQQVWFIGSYPAITAQQVRTNSQNASRPVAPTMLPFIKIGTISAINPTQPDSFEIHSRGAWNLLIASGPIVYWSPGHRDYEILGVIKRNERDAVDAPLKSNPPEKVVLSGIVVGIQHRRRGGCD
jgi:hypothetical protein